MITETLEHAFMVTGFVTAMMLVIEYVNVLTKGDWQKKLRAHKWSQYILGSLLGIAPGCLGAFAVISLYAHRILTIGAVVAAMIATSGDEAFVMFAMFPQKALLLFAILFGIGIVSGLITDVLWKEEKEQSTRPDISCLQIHGEELVSCHSKDSILTQWKKCSPHRGILVFFLAIFIFGIISGEVGPEKWDWIRFTLLLTAGTGIFVVATVSEHFLEEHFWNHIVKKHIWRVFLWTFGAMILVHFLIHNLDLQTWIKESDPAILGLLLLACLVGLIPESGPHYIFVVLYAKGVIPFSILLASSIVQDGHGMLPLLAHSRTRFLQIKAINLAIGLTAGIIGLLLGW